MLTATAQPPTLVRLLVGLEASGKRRALARGLLQCIGATTLDEYRQYIEKARSWGLLGNAHGGWLGCGAGVCTLKEEGCRKKGQVHSHDGSGTAISFLRWHPGSNQNLYMGGVFRVGALVGWFCRESNRKTSVLFWGPPLRQFYMGVSFFKRPPPPKWPRCFFWFPFQTIQTWGVPSSSPQNKYLKMLFSFWRLSKRNKL